MNKPLDFFGNEIEVGDEVAFLYLGGDIHVVGTVDGFDKFGRPLIYSTELNKMKNKNHVYRFTPPPNWIFVNTEKKHREKALDYLAAEAQDLGMYDEAVGITTLREGFE